MKNNTGYILLKKFVANMFSQYCLRQAEAQLLSLPRTCALSYTDKIIEYTFSKKAEAQLGADLGTPSIITKD